MTTRIQSSVEYYLIHTSYIFKNEVGDREETSNDTVIDCENDTEAKIAGLILAFENAEHCENNLSDIRTNPRVSCVKIGKFRPWAFKTHRGFDVGFKIHVGIYEWKMDYRPYEKELECLVEQSLEENPDKNFSFVRGFLETDVKDAIREKKLIFVW